MNKNWLITIGIIVIALIVIGVMYDNGMLNFEWQWLTVAFAALAGPYTFIKNLIFKDKKLEELKNKHQNIRNDEVIHRQTFDEEIKKREDRIQTLNKEIELAEKKIDIIELKKNNVVKEVKKSSIEEMQNDAVNYFGD
jgi:hypothetical protein